MLLNLFPGPFPCPLVWCALFIHTAIVCRRLQQKGFMKFRWRQSSFAVAAVSGYRRHPHAAFILCWPCPELADLLKTSDMDWPRHRSLRARSLVLTVTQMMAITGLVSSGGGAAGVPGVLLSP